MTRPSRARRSLRRLTTRLEELIAQWDAQHADWCCTKGCVQPTGGHAIVEFVHRDDVMIPEIVGERPCPGECTCEIGPFIRDLREAMK